MIAEELGGMLGVHLNPHVQNQSIKCPMHDDRVASMSISLPKGVWYCWACGKGGSLLTLARFLGGDLDRSDLIVETNRYHEVEAEEVDFRTKYDEFVALTPFTPEALEYRQNKGIRFETLEAFGVRHDGRGTLVMPYLMGDRVVALRYRAPDGRKWYESGSERALYGVNDIRGAGQVFLCEGESDTHSVYNLFRSDANNSVMVGGVAGANSSVERWELWALDLMWAEKVYIGFDADDAGDKGAERAIEILGQTIPSVIRARPTLANDWSDAIIAGEFPNVN